MNVVAEPRVDLESVVRPILEGLAQATGMMSVHLSKFDWSAARQSILYAHNDTHELITEGESFPWSNTLCRRALVHGPNPTVDAQASWPENAMARELDLRTFISIPVYADEASGELFGTLCAVSSDTVVLGQDTRRLMRFAAREVSRQLHLGRELTVARQQAVAAQVERGEYEVMARDLGQALREVERQRAELERPHSK